MAKQKKTAKKIARQKNLPGMTDRKIQALENAALEYAEIRDQRMELSQQEVKLKDALMKLMHKHGKKEYVRGNISIQLVVEKEKVKVRVKAEGSEDLPNDVEELEEPQEDQEDPEDFEEGEEEEEFEEAGVEG